MLMKKVWISFKIQGIIPDHVEFPLPLFSYLDFYQEVAAVNIFLDAAKKYRLTHAEMRTQRSRFLHQAYRSFSTEAIRAVQKYYLADFILFDYDLNPTF